MIGIVDYKVGNIFSVINTLDKLNLRYSMIKEKSHFAKVTKIILPGVGAFDNAIEALEKSCLLAPLQNALQSGMPTLGICLGMQLLCKTSAEGNKRGIGFFDFPVKRFQASTGMPVPHMGWNDVRIEGSKYFANQSAYYYFVHSYYVPLTDDTTGFASYGEQFSAILERDNVIGMQFHPEKSGVNGLALIKKFGESK